jgi:hypothetical protein
MFKRKDDCLGVDSFHFLAFTTEFALRNQSTIKDTCTTITTWMMADICHIEFSTAL